MINLVFIPAMRALVIVKYNLSGTTVTKGRSQKQTIRRISISPPEGAVGGGGMLLTCYIAQCLEAIFPPTERRACLHPRIIWDPILACSRPIPVERNIQTV